MACRHSYKAPNGKESQLFNQLVEEFGMYHGKNIYLETHTESFKKWFGDWEKAGVNNSTDENGEPRLFWHGTNTDKILHFREQKNFFSTSKETAIIHGNEAVERNGGRLVTYPVFIKVTPDMSVLADQVIVNRDDVSNIKSVYNQGTWSPDTENIFKSKSLTNMQEIENALIRSDSQIKAAAHESEYYTVGNKNLLRVSSWLNKEKHLEFRGDESGKDYLTEGTRYHKIVELIINGKTNSEIEAEIGVIQEPEKAFVGNMRHFVNELRLRGTVMAEVKMANVDKNIAGTIDILLIKPNGKVVIYDLKTANETPYKRQKFADNNAGKILWDIADFDFYKADRYSTQLGYYEYLASTADAVTGRPALDVEDVFIIPIEVFRDEDNNPTHVNNLKAENVRDWKAGKINFYKKGQRYIQKRMDDTVYKPETISGTSSGIDAGSFIRDALGIDLSNTQSIEQRAVNFVEQAWSQKSFHIGSDNPVQWVSDNKIDRVNQIIPILQANDENFAVNMSTGIGIYFNTEHKNPRTKAGGHTFSLKKEGDKHDIRYGRTIRLEKMLKQSAAKDVIMLSDIKGFEQYSDIVLIKRTDGAYDIVTYTNISPDTEFAVKNTGKSLNEKATNNSSTIFGNHMSSYDANLNGITLKNNYGDYMKMRLALVAMDLKNSNPDMSFNRVIVDYMYSGSRVGPRSHMFNELVPQVKLLEKLATTKELIPDTLKNVISQEADYKKSENDPVKEFAEYMQYQLSDAVDKNLVGQTDKFLKGEITRDQLADEILNGVKGMREYLTQQKYVGVSNTDLREQLSADKYFMTMARAWLSLKGIGLHPEHDVSDEFMGQLSKWIKSPTATGRKTLDKFFDVFRKHVDNIKRDVQSFLHFKEPYFRDLISEDPLSKRGIPAFDSHIAGTDALFGMTRSIMEPLLVRKKDAKGNLYTTPFLIPEGSPEYGRLTVYQKRVIKMMNDKFEEFGWPRGHIPIMRLSANTGYYKAKSNLVKGDFANAALDAKKAITIALKTAAQKGNFQAMKDDSSQFDETAYDMFASQITSEKTFSSNALANIGLDGSMNLIDIDKNNSFEIDLEKILTIFVTTKIKKREMDKALPVYHMFRSIFKYYELAHGMEQPDTIKMIDEYVADLAFNVKTGEDLFLSNFLNVSMRLASMTFIGFNPLVWVRNGIQMSLASITDTLANTITDDPRFPGMKSWRSASAKMALAMKDPGEMMKMTLLRQKYLTEDLSVLTGNKHQKTARGLMNEQLAYAFDRNMESGFRTHYLIAQLEKDGLYDAHSVVRQTGPDGQERYTLVYDPKLDPRFKGEDGKLFYEALKKSMSEKGELDANGEISGAYDWHLRERLKAYINRGIGSFDRDLASPWARHALMFSISQFRTWFVSKFQRATKLEYEAEIFGDWKKDETGQFVWADETMKGMLWTLSESFIIIPRLMKEWTGGGKADVSLEDRRNMAYALMSASSLLVLFTLAAALSNADGDDEDEETLPDWLNAKLLAVSAIRDASSIFVPTPFLTILTDPFVFVGYYQQLLDATKQSITYGFEGDHAKMWNTWSEVVPVINAMPDGIIKMEEDTE